jgi:hypothetical protein
VQDYDEEFLLQELQRLLTANNQLLQYQTQLESDNKMLQQEGDLLSEQLESACLLSSRPGWFSSAPFCAFGSQGSAGGFAYRFASGLQAWSGEMSVSGGSSELHIGSVC